MPGLVAIVGGRSAVSENELERMLEVVTRPAQAQEGRLHLPEVNVSLGWVVHAGSMSDCLPIWNEARSIVAVVFGEDFQDPGVVQALRSKGHQFGRDDLSHVVHLYEEYGERFVDHLNGVHCGFLIDLPRRTVVAFNDRFALSRLYIHERSDGTVVFASEAKSILRLHPELRRLNPQSLGEHLACGCVLQNRSLFQDIRLLPPASRWLFRKEEAPQKQQYLDPSGWDQAAKLSPEDYETELQTTFARVLPKYLGGRIPPAMSLTGGFDGRFIMAWARLAKGSLPTYSFAGPIRDCADVKIARKVAQACGQTHETLRIQEDFFSRFRDLASDTVYVSDGTMNVSGAVELYVNALASKVSKVRLTGNYGSELVRGNVAFRANEGHASLFDPEVVSWIDRAIGTYQSERAGGLLSFIASKQVPWHHYARFSVEQSQLTVRSPFLDRELVSLVGRAPLASIPDHGVALRLVRAGRADMARIPTDRGFALGPNPALLSLLRLYQEFTIRLEYVYDYGMPPWMVGVDRVLSPLKLHQAVLGRHKFYHLRLWYRTRLAEAIRSVLLDPAALNRAYLRKGVVETIVNEHIQGRANHTLQLHTLLSMEFLQRRLLELHP